MNTLNDKDRPVPSLLAKVGHIRTVPVSLTYSDLARSEADVAGRIDLRV